jgi:ABC-type Fe3+ transport system substrate-binding protein
MAKIHPPCALQKSPARIAPEPWSLPMIRSALTLSVAMLTAVTLAITTASAQSPAQTMAEIASYQGPDRMERLIAGAKKEGVISVYGSSVSEDMKPISDAFKAKYGIDFQYWRASSENLVQRTVAETRAGRCLVDGFATVAAELEALHREKLLQAVKTPLTAGLMPQALRPHGEWVASRLNIFSAAYNTNLVKKDEVPKSYEDLKHPRWKGRLAVEADDGDWFGTIVTKMGRDQGVALFRDIVRTNGMQVRKGHTLLSNLVVAGEIPLALTTYSYKPEQQKREGAPIEPLYLAPVVALGYGPAVARCAPHPHAAVLFNEFMLGEGQEIFAKRDMAVTNPKIPSIPPGLEITLIDPADMLDNRSKWDELWASTVTKPR